MVDRELAAFLEGGVVIHLGTRNEQLEQQLRKGTSDSVWQRISATAGHRLHLESDSASLRDIQCVTCHGLTVHQFVPADSTCGQSSCHQQTEIRLAGMRNQTALHCARSIEYAVQGYPKMKPAFVRATIGKLVLGRFLKSGFMTPGSRLAMSDTTWYCGMVSDDSRSPPGTLR